MMVTSAHLGPVPGICGRVVRRGHFGAWRALTALPAMVGSLLLLLVLFGWMGAWAGVVLLVWLASAAAVFSRAGERAVVGLGCGFRRPTRAQATALETVWSGALADAEIATADVDLYVQRSRELNAYAAGGRSIAITTGVLREFMARRLGADEMQAVLVHELGHHATRATKFALLTMWLALPWRFASRLVLRIGRATVGKRQLPRLLAVVVTGAVLIAMVQAIQQRQWAVAAVLSAVAACAVVCPLVDATVSRRSEYAADRYAACAGQGPKLAAALQVLGGEQRRRTGLVARLLSRHPSTSRRIAFLKGTPDRFDVGGRATVSVAREHACARTTCSTWAATG